MSEHWTDLLPGYVILLFAGIFLGLAIGLTAGKQIGFSEARREAVTSGAANWVAGEDGSAVFEWVDNSDSSDD